jgi:protease I
MAGNFFEVCSYRTALSLSHHRSILLFVMAFVISSSVICSAQYRPKNSSSKKILLPPPKMTGAASLEQLLAKRRSVREFSGKNLDYAQIGQLAWAGQGITDSATGYRTAPSAGALYPITLYFATSDGLFAYDPQQHALEAVSTTDVRRRLATTAAQKEIADAPCDIIIAGDISKLQPKYAHKARRFAMLEAGHIAQNILLEAVSLQLAAVPIGAFETKNVAAICNLPVALEPFYIICVGYPPQLPLVPETKEPNEPNERKETSEMNAAGTKKVVLIVPSENFRDEELFNTQNALTDIKAQITIASSKMGIIKGMLGGKAEAEILIDDVDVNDYDAVVFIGGSGAKEYFNNKTALSMAQQAKEKGKILAAVCIAPTILANAGVLKGVKATSFPSEQGVLKKAGAVFTGADVERDGLIITGNGPKASEKFGKTIADALTSE